MIQSNSVLNSKYKTMDSVMILASMNGGKDLGTLQYKMNIEILVLAKFEALDFVLETLINKPD